MSNKFSTLVRNFSITDQFKEIIKNNLTTEGDVAPGQLWQNGDWYGLTYLKSNKTQKFNPSMWDYEVNESNTIRVIKFKQSEGKLLICGGQPDADKIESHFGSLLLGKADGEGKIKYDDYYKFDKPVIDLSAILKKYEENNRVADVKKLKIKKVEITLGHINNCTVMTGDYGGATKVLTEQGESIIGMEVLFSDIKKTSIFIDINGLIRVITKSTDVNPEEIAIDAAKMF